MGYLVRENRPPDVIEQIRHSVDTSLDVGYERLLRFNQARFNDWQELVSVLDEIKVERGYALLRET